MTKHLLKLNEIEDQFRELTNKFEEVNFKLDKLSIRVTKIQSDTQLRFSDIRKLNIKSKEKKIFTRISKATRFWSSTGYQTQFTKEQAINSIESAQTVITEEARKKRIFYQISPQKNNMSLL